MYLDNYLKLHNSALVNLQITHVEGDPISQSTLKNAIDRINPKVKRASDR